MGIVRNISVFAVDFSSGGKFWRKYVLKLSKTTELLRESSDTKHGKMTFNNLR